MPKLDPIEVISLGVIQMLKESALPMESKQQMRIEGETEQWWQQEEKKEVTWNLCSQHSPRYSPPPSRWQQPQWLPQQRLQ